MARCGCARNGLLLATALGGVLLVAAHTLTHRTLVSRAGRRFNSAAQPEAHRAGGPQQESASTHSAGEAPSSAPIPAKAPIAFVPRARIDGNTFPDHVLALTWDDGPDTNSLALARYLRAEGVSGTFFVVAAWIRNVSEEPGVGERVFETGYERLPILGDLVALRQRLGNHTENHVLLAPAAPETILRQVMGAEARIGRFRTTELCVFRPPGGAWSDGAGVLLDAEGQQALRGPVFWDIDQKDWEGSLFCRSSKPAVECETPPHLGTPRVRAKVVAARYLAEIERVKHGIVLLHDRVGDVGSTYATDIAHVLIPELKARHYVFAAPLLEFSPQAPRLQLEHHNPALETRGIALGDIDGDGRADLCWRSGSAIRCARARPPVDGKPSAFGWEGDAGVGASGVWAERQWPQTAPVAWSLADVSGDGRADLCEVNAAGIVCATTEPSGGFGARSTRLATPLDPRTTPQFADVDGDGRSDVCYLADSTIRCARSGHEGFLPPQPWLPLEASAAAGAHFLLGDVDGDGRADLCLVRPSGIECALSTGAAFGALRSWSAVALDAPDAGAEAQANGINHNGDIGAPLWLADVNGDGRKDLCFLSVEGVGCGLSDGRRFLGPTNWLAQQDRVGWRNRPPGRTVAFGDMNGDGRADVCVEGPGGVACGLAP